ncbi:MAG: hypothetical protein A2Y00_00090 [Omnitrophica WOR_2 bacterium GWF2_43_52]|nr:MAG: hypothetical protein A2062_07640 [Omnitrophica WOR_2 bacterium GWA2_44_7]OGX17665.1 MAG: hypothetical protein A2Y01_05540 [Omnitrophica WOR_2 bacterium GWC2_44_8]OGX20674.1 MAG: hypothetical protein A2Y00_00090 [Omnitrophica WOR_2 bacterium GWF2_43_52]OGX55593.1 MAG: hypothetical protein A2460_08575 [Omnitrophica WOR_2 bacterium RIFOXYC2_FULL_43_9]HAH21325.1 sodium:proton exchanger [Candidatus Omnitrophota bacterium]
MGIAVNFAIFILSGFLLLKSAELFIKGALEISLALRLSKVFIGATIVSLVTTSPELVVSVTSSAMGEVGLAVGNAIGSCICNIGLVFAFGAILRDIKVEREDFNSKVGFLIAALIVVYFFILDKKLDRKEAVILLVLQALFLGYNYHLALKHRKQFKVDIPNAAENSNLLKKGFFLFLIGGIATVIIARYGLVSTGINIARFLGVPPAVIGLSLIALGTSLPELFTTIVSSRKQHSDIAVGNIIGASILDLLLVLGVSALVNPLTIDTQTLFFNMPSAMAITLVMFFLGFKSLRFTRKKGIILLLVYLVYIAALFIAVYK